MLTSVSRWVPVVIACCGLLAGCGSSDPDPAKLAASIGASTCDKTSFKIESKLDGEKRTVYDCYFKGDYRYRCVTESGNIAKDETDTVIALFEDTFTAEKPRCA